MKTLRTLLLALPVIAAGSPAFAGKLTGNYLITIKSSHDGGTTGQTSCATLVDDGSYLGWANSGSVTIGAATGNFFASGSNILAIASTGNTTFIFTGYFHNSTITPAQFETFTNGVGVDSGQFTAVPGGC